MFNHVLDLRWNNWDLRLNFGFSGDKWRRKLSNMIEILCVEIYILHFTPETTSEISSTDQLGEILNKICFTILKLSLTL